MLKLYANLYKSNAMRNVFVSSEDVGDGINITAIEIDHQAKSDKEYSISGTNMHVKKVRLAPHHRVSIDIAYHYTLNKGSFLRTGQIAEGSYFIAYFYPRVAVYDDIDGWNEYAYLGKEEFYNDYGNFKASITVPDNYSVWSTGTLTNGKELYQPAILKKIEEAEKSDSVIDVINRDEIQNKNVTRHKEANTWNFEADNVTDLAFAVSDKYVWKASSIEVDRNTHRRTRIDAVYDPNHNTYDHVADYARKTVEQISYHLPRIPFPYPHISIVDGLDAMEYPMMVNDLPFKDERDVVEFTAHEVFHSIFPFYVGTNETKYSFMDEGWATMTEFMFHPLIAPQVKMDYDISSVNDYAGLAEDMPLMTPTPQLYGKARYGDKDLKPALALYYLKEALGEKKFIDALQFFIKTWAGKHPTPYDFFNCMNHGTGADLNWYWKKWYFEKAVPDLSIEKVSHKGSTYQISIINKGTVPMPIHVRVIMSDSTTKDLLRTVNVWKDNDKVMIYLHSKKSIKRIVLGNAYDADVNPADNVWLSNN
ncbi:M1 family metallopeptidase [Mucilaginibacter sp. AK015]|uniref:M1 family metallopeptidase n=1 Tax=Mucilaginibacter sp. AK015 TaxID=2723072 RepID=UPI00160ADAE3|nr:hypothetical protein [Mucilaginibacter sp. AK015]